MKAGPETSHPLAQIARLFLKLGIIGFGGPAAHIAMMEEEVVRRRQWLTQEEFLDLLGASNLIPGPNSTELAIHIGHRRAGWPGLLVAGTCFILPAMLIVMACAWGYSRWGKLPSAEAILYGIKPVIIAIVVQALWSLSKAAVKTKTLGVIAVIAAVLTFLRVNELVVLFGAGVVLAMVPLLKRQKKNLPSFAFPVSALKPVVAATVPISASASAATAFGLGPLFLFFLKVGSVLFGSGYVLLAFLRTGLVEHRHWLTEAQLLDSIAVGQMTPGPVFTTATFIGYILGGVPAALVATIGIFLPAFVFVAASGPLVPGIRRSPALGAFLDGVNVASLALMAVVTWQLCAAALVDWVTVVLAIVSAVLLLKFKLNSAWLVAGGAAVGLIKMGAAAIANSQ